MQGRKNPGAHAAPARDLQRLALEMEEVVAAARALGYPVVRIEAGTRAPEAIAEQIEAELRAGPAAPAPD